MPCFKADTIFAAVESAAEAAAAPLPGKWRAEVDARRVLLVLAAVLCAVLPLEISHLLSALAGAGGYLLLQALQPSLDRRTSGKARAAKVVDSGPAVTAQRGNRHAAPLREPAAASPPPRRPVCSAPKPEQRKATAVPVLAPSFNCVGWEAEVQEFLGQISPTPEGDAAVAHIARAVKQAIWAIVPEADVAGFAAGNILSGTAFGVAVPEVDIVISVNPSELWGRLQGRWSQGRVNGGAPLDTRKLQKSAIRAFTDRLVSRAAFKFRRSAFRGQEPKVTLIAPPIAGLCEQGVPMNLSVNAITPLYAAALLTECGLLDDRAKSLILLVKRWAKDRGVSHAAKGHLSPYAWTLLAIYYLQVGVEGEGPLLPPLEGFEATGGLLAKGRGGPAPAGKQSPPSGPGPKTSVAELFRGFLEFYTESFEWKKEAICVRTGRRASPDLSLPLHIVLHEDGTSTEVGPSIEDPFEVGHNLGACSTALSLERLHAELVRAARMCATGISLSQLLEPWTPPEATGGAQEHEAEED